ncbi:hypothetical protein [Paludisphaera soli]|uniref:hypothetical protein n=1 Tax=Paludisphaera soli TaxID=2712865 RepID=UPI0013EE2747|nr:hypothetical protein [Paludisphaera soli]
MRSKSALLPVPAALGLVLTLAGDAEANCRHGHVHCTACGGYGYGYGYGYNVMPAPVPTPAPTPGPIGVPGSADGLGGPPPPPGGAAPGLLQSASGVMLAPTTRPTYYSPYYGYMAAPAAAPATAAAPAANYGYYGAAAAPEPARPSFLDGYSEMAPILPVAAGAPLFNGQLFGSHIFQVLKQFGQGLDKQALFEMAVKAFVNASGVAPTTAEREILQRIVGQVIRSVGGGGGNGGGGFGDQPQDRPAVGTRPPAVAGGTVVTIEIPPGGRVEIINKGGQVVKGVKQDETAGGEQEDFSGPSPPPTEAAPAMPELPEQAPEAEPTTKKAPEAEPTTEKAPEQAAKKRVHPG